MTPVNSLDVEKIAKAVLLYVFIISMTASLSSIAQIVSYSYKTKLLDAGLSAKSSDSLVDHFGELSIARGGRGGGGGEGI